MYSTLAGTLLFSVLVQAGQHNVTIPNTAPKDAETVPADFFGFGFESGLVPHYNNDFSENLVNSIASRMSKPLVIRIGGTSGDNIFFDRNQKNGTYCDSGPECKKFSRDVFHIGPDYFDTFKRFQKASMSVQAPIGAEIDIENSVAYVHQAYKALGKDRVAAIALGNEPNWYKQTVETYVKHALDIENHIVKNLTMKGDDSHIFQVGEIASEAVGSEKFNIEKVVQQGINKNGLSKIASEHFYQSNDKFQDKKKYTAELLQERLMNHKAIVNRLKPYASDVSKVGSLPLIISEMGSALGSSPPRWGGGFGAAMWAVDIHLAAMARGIKKICNTQQPTATHSFWIPDNSGTHTTGPAVQGLFPAAAFITEFVGKDDTLGKIVELPSSGAEFSAYAMYNLKSNKPQRIALVNLHEWNKDSKAKRGTSQVTLDVGDEVKSAEGRYMSSRSGSFARGFDLGGQDEVVTFAGEQWSFKLNQGKGSFVSNDKEQTTKLTVKGGKVTVPVQDTEAVIINLQ